nr:Mbeg1-like protein [Paenibacillus castaneae]
MTDKQYLMLATIVEFNIADEYKQRRIKEIVSHISESAELENYRHLQNQYNEVIADEAIGSLELMDKMKSNGAGAYSFKNEHDDRVIIFTYKSSSWMEDLQTFLNGESSVFQEAFQFLRKNKGDYACSVVGHSLGGAVALYAAATVGGVGGVVFDAPGIATLLTSEQRDSLKVKNYIAYNSLISAAGVQAEEHLFAKPSDEAAAIISSDDDVQGRYMFDRNEKVIVGDPGEIYILLSKLNSLTEDESPAFTEVMDVFAANGGLEQKAEDHLGYFLLMLIEQLDAGKIRASLAEISYRFDRLVQDKYKVWRYEINEKLDQLAFDELADGIAAISENRVLDAAETMESIYRCTEAVLSILVVSDPNSQLLSNMLDAGLDHFTDALEETMNKLSEQMSAQLDKMIESKMNSMLQLPELKFDL